MGLSPVTCTEWIWFISGVFLFILCPGSALIKCLKLEMKSFMEETVFSIILGCLSLYILAYSVFLVESDLPSQIFIIACSACALWILHRIYLTRFWLYSKEFCKKCLHKLRSPYFFSYSLLVVVILFYFNYHQQQGYLARDDSGKLLGFAAHWDDLHLISILNETRNKFLPEDNPFLPGELPVYYNWLSNLLPSFFIKYLKIDQLHAYYIWSPLFLQISFILFIHYLIRQFTRDEWVPLFSVGLFFLTQKLVFDITQLRDIAGMFLIFSTLVFIVKFFSTQKKVYIALSFNWAFLYITKANYLAAMLPGLAVFYLQTLFQRNFPRWDIKVLRLLLLCSVLPVFLLWFSKTYFSSIFVPDPLVFNFPMIIRGGINILLPTLPMLVVYVYYYKKFKREGTLSPLELALWCTLIGILLYSSLLYGNKIEGKANHLIFLSLVTAFPLVVRQIILKAALFRGLGIALLILCAILSFNRPLLIDIDKGYIAMSEDEIEAIKFIRNNTPEESVILYNIPRYNDRPAIMSSMTYRKSFIDEGERFANIFNVILEQRLYDYWDFLFCECTQADREYFFTKYPNLSYIVEYDESFKKQILPIKGLPYSVFPIPITNKDPNLFQQVFRNGKVTVYRINRDIMKSN